MNTRTLFICLVIAMNFSTSVKAQFCYKDADHRYFIEFLASTTIFVLTGEEEMDSQIVRAVKKYWTITPYEFHNIAFAHENQKNSKYSFFVRYFSSNSLVTYVNPTFGLFAGSPFKITKNGIVDKTSIHKIASVFYHEIHLRGKAYEPFGCLSWDLLLSSVTHNLILIRDYETTSDDGYEGMAEINIESDRLKTKTLVIAKEYEVNKTVFNQFMFNEHSFDDYPYKHEYIPIEEIKELIKNKDPDYCLFIPVFDQNGWHGIVYDLEDGIMINWIFQNERLRFDKTYFRELTEVIAENNKLVPIK